MKGLTKPILGLIVIALIVWGYNATQNQSPSDVQADEGEGRIFVSITDDTADISSVNEIELEVEEVSVYSQTEGWTTISSDSRTYSLLALKAEGKLELHGIEAIETGAYNQARIVLGDVVVDSQTQGRAEAVLPSNELTFDLDVQVEEGSDSHLTLDFLADQSLHTSSEGQFVFAPVVSVETRSGVSVEVSEDNSVVVSGGSINASKTIGVDLNGQTRANFTIGNSQGLQVETSPLGEVQFMLNGETFIGGSAESDRSGNEDRSNDGSQNGSESNGTNVDSEVNGDVDIKSNGSGIYATSSSEAEGGIDLGL